MGKKILIIDDDRSICSLLSHLLDNKGYDTAVSHSATDGLKKIKSELPHLVILDVMLPDLLGWDVLKTMRQGDTTKDIPVLMCTEKNLMDDVEKAMESGAQGYITKPFEIDRVIEKISRTIG
ncbi:MAG: response regulator [Elusimicrobia bacterium]|nr:response regulator [Elusimicrobiota bacterium]